MDRLQFSLQEHKLDVTISATISNQSLLLLNQMLNLIQAQDMILATHAA